MYSRYVRYASFVDGITKRNGVNYTKLNFSEIFSPYEILYNFQFIRLGLVGTRPTTKCMRKYRVNRKSSGANTGIRFQSLYVREKCNCEKNGIVSRITQKISTYFGC